jgi:hypothetical protein
MANLSSKSFHHQIVTTANSGANQSTCSFSLSKKDIGIRRGKYKFCTHIDFIILFISSFIFSQIVTDFGKNIIHQGTGLYSNKSQDLATSRYH